MIHILIFPYSHVFPQFVHVLTRLTVKTLHEQLASHVTLIETFLRGEEHSLHGEEHSFAFDSVMSGKSIFFFYFFMTHTLQKKKFIIFCMLLYIFSIICSLQGIVSPISSARINVPWLTAFYGQPGHINSSRWKYYFASVFFLRIPPLIFFHTFFTFPVYLFFSFFFFFFSPHRRHLF